MESGEFAAVLAWLRQLAWPCAPPIGIGEFEVLYASAREVVVWYTPAREGHRTGEVAIPCARLEVAWQMLAAGTPLDEERLMQAGGSVALGRWLLALLALLPGAQVREEPLLLTWAPPTPAHTEPSPATASADAPPEQAAAPRARRRRNRSA